MLVAIGGDPTFREGVVSGFLLILFSELGDKTFFIALLLALKQSQGLVFVGTFGALGIMTVISVGTPFGLPNVCDILQFPNKVQYRGLEGGHCRVLMTDPGVTGSSGPGATSG